MIKRFFSLSLMILLALTAWGQSASRLGRVNYWGLTYGETTRTSLANAARWNKNSNNYRYNQPLSNSAVKIGDTDLMQGLLFTVSDGNKLSFGSNQLAISSLQGIKIALPELSAGNVVSITTSSANSKYLTFEGKTLGTHYTTTSAPVAQTAEQTYDYKISEGYGANDYVLIPNETGAINITSIIVYTDDTKANESHNYTFSSIYTTINSNYNAADYTWNWANTGGYFPNSKYSSAHVLNIPFSTSSNENGITELDGLTFITGNSNNDNNKIRVNAHDSNNGLYLICSKDGSNPVLGVGKVLVPITRLGSTVKVTSNRTIQQWDGSSATGTDASNVTSNVYTFSANSNPFYFRCYAINDATISNIAVLHDFATVSGGTSQSAGVLTFDNGTLSIASTGNTCAKDEAGTDQVNAFFTKTAENGDVTITITATPNDGYYLSSISGTYYNTAEDQSHELIISGTDNTRTFTMPTTGDVTLSATFSKVQYALTASAGENSYITFKETDANGAVITSGSTIDWGTTVYVEASASENYYLSSLKRGDDNYTSGTAFVMPKSAVVFTSVAAAKNTPTVSKVDNFTYDGQSHNLVTATAYDATLSYSYKVGDGNFSEWSGTIPSATNVGTYTVKWKATGGTQSKSVEETTLEAVIVSKATPTITTPPTASAITEGQTLASSTLSGGEASVEGSFAWTNSTIIPAVSDSQTTNYEVTFTPTDTDNYNTATTNVKLTVNSASFTPSVSITGWTYGETPNTPSVEGNTSGGEITYTYYTDSNLSVQTTTENSGAVSEGAVPVNAGTYYVNATIAANGIYGVATASTNFTIAKATPTITTLPTASAITAGQTLASSTLSGGVASVDGTFAWTDNTITPSVSDSEITPYNVTFIPNDAANYNTATTTVNLTVTAANVVTSLAAFVGTKTFTSDATGNWTANSTNTVLYTPITNPQFMALSRADQMAINSTYGLRLGKAQANMGGALVFYVGATSDIAINIKQVQPTDTSDNPLMVDYMGTSFEALTTGNYATAGTNKASGTLTSSNTTLQLTVSGAQAGYYKVYSSTYRFGVTSLTIIPIHSVTAATSTGTDTYGTVAAESTTVAEGATTTITATPATGYQVSNWAVSGEGASISPSGDSNSNTTTLTMGTADATVTCTFEPINYDITVTQPASGGTFTVKVGDADEVSANTTANYNQTITLANTPNNGFVLSSYSVIKTASSESINVSNGQFTMPAETVTVTATFVNNTSAESTFTISSLLSNGTITATVDEAVVNSGSSVAEGKSVVLTVTPEEGYHLKTGTLKYTYNDGEDHDVAIDETTKTFIMPAYAVTVSATFEADSSEPAGTAVVHMCGDSMMSIYGNQSNDESATTTYNQGMRGWGQYFGDYVNLTVQDWAHTGTTAKGFYTGANYWKVVMGTNQMTDAYKLERPYVVDFEAVKAGDYVIMCWGHNDQKGGTLHNGYKTLEESEYITYITTMVNEVRDKGAYPILATSICRALFSGKNLTRLGKIDACEAAGETHTDSNDPYNYPEAMRKLANDLNVPLIDLNQASQTLWEDFGPGLTASVFFEGVGTTHTAEAGARAMGIAANLIIRDWDTSDAKYANYAALRAAMKTDVEQYKKSDYAARETTVATETTWTFEKSADGETTYSSSDVIANALVDFNGLYLRANESHTLNAQGVSGSFTFSNEKQVSWTMGLISSAMSSSPCSDASTAGMGVTTSSDRCVAINISGPGTFYVAMRTKGDPTSGRLFNLAFDGTIVDSKASSKNVVELKYKANKAGVFYVWGTEGYIIVAAHYVPTADTSEAEMHEQTERNLGVTLDGIQKWATYFSDINLAIPAGVTAYRVASVNGNTVNVEEVDYIKANRGVLLYSETAVDPEDLIVGAGSGTDYTSELLGSTSAGSMTSGTNYVLYNNQFILAEDTTLPANRCYIHLSGSATSRGLTIVPGNGNTTGIEDIPKDEGKQTKDQYYNMNGQRIDKPTKKGLYIVNGRKVVIK